MHFLRVIAIGAAIFTSACATHIEHRDETIQPSKVRLGSFNAVQIAPLLVEKSEGDSGDLAAIERIKTSLATCLRSVFKGAVPTGATPAAAGTLVVEPAIEDLKKVNVAERFFVGAMAGSSAVLLRTRYRDGSTNEIVASPVFYQRAAAMSGAWTIGGQDNAMLDRVVNLACDYARQNY